MEENTNSDIWSNNQEERRAAQPAGAASRPMQPNFGKQFVGQKSTGEKRGSMDRADQDESDQNLKRQKK